MMKQLWAMTLLLGMSSTAHAEDFPQYFGVTVNQYDLEFDDFEILSGGSLDDSSDGYTLTYGRYLTDRAAVEFSYMNMGEYTLNQSAGDTFRTGGTDYYWLVDVNVTVETTAFAGLFKYDFVVEPNYALFGKVGIVEGDYEYSDDTFEDDDFSGMQYGFGLDYFLDQKTSFRVSYDVTEDDDEYTGINVGFTYQYD